MKKLIQCTIIIYGIITFNSCKKEKDTDENQQKLNTFLPFQIGNWWIYEYTTVDSVGNLIGNPKFDTVKIIGSTTIHGNEFYEFSGSYEYECSNCSFLQRDSIGYLVDQLGNISFSVSDFTNLLFFDTVPDFVGVNGKMKEKNELIKVPAGTMSTYLFEYKLFFNSEYQFQNPRIGGKNFALNIGLVKNRRFYVGSPNYVEVKLVKCFIQ